MRRSLARHRRARRPCSSSRGSGWAGTPTCCPALRARRARRRRRRAGLRGGRRHHQARLLPQRSTATQLLDKSLGAAVKSLDDQFSNYFSPKDYADFQEVTQGQFSGVGMTVEETEQGLRVMTVYDGSPAAKGGLEPGDVIVAVNGRSIAGDLLGGLDRADQGPGRHARSTLTVDVRQARARGQARARAGRHPGRRVLDGAQRRRARSATCASPASPRARTARSARRSTSCCARAPTGSCSTCATTAAACSTRRCSSPRSSSPRAGSSRPRAARGPSASTRRRAARSRPRSRSPCSSTASPRRRRRSSPARCRTASARGRRHAHVRQGRLPGDRAALQRRRAGHHGRRVLPAQRPQHRRRRGRQGRRHHAGREGASTTRRPSRTRRSTRPSAWSCATAREAPPRGGPPERPLGGPVVAVLERRGRFLTAEPFFHRGAADERRAPARRLGRAPGRPRARRPRTGRAPGHAKILRRIGRPDVARDVSRRCCSTAGCGGASSRTWSARRARPPSARRPTTPRAALDLRALPTFTIDPPTAQRLRRRDLGRGHGRRRGARVGPHRRRLALRQARLARRPRGVPARDQRLRARARSSRCCPRCSPTAPARWCRTRTGSRSPSSSSSTARRCAAARSTARSSAPTRGWTTRSVDRIFAGDRARRGAVGGAAGRRAAGRGGAGGGAAGARRARGRVGRARVRVLARGPRHRAGGERADRVAHADRAPDDRGQRGGRGAAGGAQAGGAVPRARAPGARARRASGRPARLARRPDAAAAGPDDAAAGRRPGRGDLAPRRPGGPPPRPRPRRADVARAAHAQAGALLPEERRPRRPAARSATATSPRRSAATRT